MDADPLGPSQHFLLIKAFPDILLTLIKAYILFVLAAVGGCKCFMPAVLSPPRRGASSDCRDFGQTPQRPG